MPKVGAVKYPYTAAGRVAAKAASKATGKPMENMETAAMRAQEARMMHGAPLAAPVKKSKSKGKK